MEGEMYVLQKMLPASMLPMLRDTVNFLCDGFSLSLKFQWAVSLSVSISSYRPAEPPSVLVSDSTVWIVCGPSSSKLGPPPGREGSS